MLFINNPLYRKALNASAQALLGAFIFFFAITPTFANTPFVDTEITIRVGRDSISGTFLPAEEPDGSVLVILVSSVKGNDRNISNKSKIAINFKALAEGLSKCGISSFRFDNRGIGKSSGENESATLYTHADDLKSVYNYFKHNKRFKNFKIGIIGHSEGGASSEVLAAKTDDISFLILLSAQGNSGWQFFDYQLRRYYEILGNNLNEHSLADSLYKQNAALQKRLFDILATDENYVVIRKNLREFINKRIAQESNSSIELEKLYQEWQSAQQIALRKFNPSLYLFRIKCPVLALNGDRDDSVDGLENLKKIEKELESTNKSTVDIQLLPNVNHYYRTLRNEKVWNLNDKNELFSSNALDKICQWVRSLYP